MEYTVRCFGVPLKFPKNRERLYVVRADTKEVLLVEEGDGKAVHMPHNEVKGLTGQLWFIHNHLSLTDMQCSPNDVAVANKHKHLCPDNKSRFFVTTEIGWSEFDELGTVNKPTDIQEEVA